MQKDKDKGRQKQTSARVLQFVWGAQFLVCSTSKTVLLAPVDKKKNKKNTTLHPKQQSEQKKAMQIKHL